jgi:glutathione peroxidase
MDSLQTHPTPENTLMKKSPAFAVLFSLLAVAFVSNAAEKEAANKDAGPVLNHKMKSLAGKEVDLARYKGKVVLIVNTASQCGLTPQYKGLEALHEQYSEKGLAVLGFPCNQFGGQEPGTAEEITEFCTKNYGVKFDLFEKIEVNGEGRHDLYKYLTAQDTKPAGKGDIKWNFEKFLIGRDGKIIARFAPTVKPQSKEVVAAIEAELAKSAK